MTSSPDRLLGFTVDRQTSPSISGPPGRPPSPLGLQGPQQDGGSPTGGWNTHPHRATACLTCGPASLGPGQAVQVAPSTWEPRKSPTLCVLCLLAKTPSSQCRGPRFDPGSGNQVPHATTKSSQATIKDPSGRNKDRRPHTTQPRPGSVK